MFTFMPLPIQPVTPKGGQTRERILQVAHALFAESGYEGTTLRDIAEGAGCSLGLLYRYFARREDLALALYDELCDRFTTATETIEAKTLSARFREVMQARLRTLRPHQAALRALVVVALDPASSASVLSAETASIRARVTAIFERVAEGATDFHGDSRQAASALYAVHQLLLLAWIQDATPSHRATTAAIDLASEALGLFASVSALPVAHSITARLHEAITAFTPQRPSKRRIK